MHIYQLYEQVLDYHIVCIALAAEIIYIVKKRENVAREAKLVVLLRDHGELIISSPWSLNRTTNFAPTKIHTPEQ